MPCLSASKADNQIFFSRQARHVRLNDAFIVACLPQAFGAHSERRRLFAKALSSPYSAQLIGLAGLLETKTDNAPYIECPIPPLVVQILSWSLFRNTYLK
jgi:hypothetical protein